MIVRVPPACGRRTAEPLLSGSATGAFGHDADRPTHRLVHRLVEGEMQVVEVLAVGPREQDVAYLMAGLRLGRITDPYRKLVAERIVHRVLSRFRGDA